MITNIDDNPRGVVVHLTEADTTKQAGVIKNINNLLNELGANTPVELVVNGPGMTAVLTDAPVAGQLRELLGRGAIVAACSNTMRERSISVHELIDGVTVVPAGIAQVVRRQWEGWAYVRP